MMIKLTKQLFAFLLVVFVAFLFPGITAASANNLFSSPSENTKYTITISENDLTPQERQKLQAVRQRRNKEILAILDSSQHQQLAQSLHNGSDFNQALEALDLSSEQQDLINAVIDFTNLKLKRIVSQHLIFDKHR